MTFIVQRIKYYGLSLITLFSLPFLYFQAKAIRKRVPELPEAKNPKGVFGKNFKSSQTILFIGESTLAGVGVEEHKNGFAGTFARIWSAHYETKVDWKVYARSGYTVKSMLEKLVPKLEEDLVDVIILGVGGNDAFTFNRPWKFKKEVERLIERLIDKYPNAQIYLPNVPPIKAFPAFTPLIRFCIGNHVELLAFELQRVSSQFENIEFNGQFLKLEDWLQHLNPNETTDAFFSDGVHPSAKTYQLWAQDFFHFILEKNY